MSDSQAIPGPPGLPLLGNIGDLDPADGIGSLGRLADTYGEIFKLTLGGADRIFISSVALMNEVCDEKRFTKAVSGALEQIRNGVEDGLFTAYPGEHNWEVAHRTLMPAFGPLSIRSMFDEMHDIASQLVVKWARFGSEEKIDVTSDFTRLTLDSIALCAMDVRFNSFYRPEMHPFVDAMVGMLAESGNRARRPAIANYFMRGSQQKYDSDIALLKQVAAEVVAQRKKHPSDKKDLLNAMMIGRDPKTGEGLTDRSVMNNMITFLIAGHETTSGLMSFLFYYLIKNPTKYQAAQAEVDKVIGRGPITVEHISQLPYLNACLRETLRLTPTAPAFTLQPLATTDGSPILLGGKYKIQPGQPIIAILPKIHRDPVVYGDDAEEFKPERMLDEPFSKLPPNAWKPFGNGVRGCIGRPFAWQEALLSTAMLLQNFNFRMDNPTYTLKIKQTLTIKPKDFYMHASLREGIDPVHLEKQLHVNSSKNGTLSEKDRQYKVLPEGSKTQPMTILYGSNSGTCEALAQGLARTAGSKGFNVKVNTLDSAVAMIPKNEPVVLISSSYEGHPPDNAAHFLAWLESLKGGKELDNVKYTVYGCGNHDWVSTFHKVPKTLDSLFAANGASRLANAGFGDVAAGDIFNDFDKYQDEVFWPVFGDLKTSSEDDAGIDLAVDTSSRHTTLRQDVKEAIILSNELLTIKGEPQKRHIVLTLPTGATYKAGDYLAVLPINNSANIRRVLRRFGLPWDAMVTIKSGANTTLPTGYPISAMDLLGAYVELSQPATRRNVQKIASTVADEIQSKKLLQMAGPDFDVEVGEKRLSPLDILEQYPTAALSLSSFLAMLPPMRIRQYSISSSPLSDPTKASITWSVLDTPSKAGGRFLGVASNYLLQLEPEDHIHVAVKPSHGGFRLPADIENTPIIMLCAGTGLAPFRGFVEERAMQKAAGRQLAPAFLFIGCAHPDRDRLFADELDRWAAEGVVKIFYAYSKGQEISKDCHYVQDRLWEEREEMKQEFNRGAKIYICGSAAVGEGAANMIKKIYTEASEAKGEKKTEAQIEEWFESIKSDRYASDVFV